MAASEVVVVVDNMLSLFCWLIIDGIVVERVDGGTNAFVAVDVASINAATTFVLDGAMIDRCIGQRHCYFAKKR